MSVISKHIYSNLDPFTETYGLAFYLQYLTHWPEYFQVAESPTGDIMGYSEFERWMLNHSEATYSVYFSYGQNRREWNQLARPCHCLNCCTTISTVEPSRKVDEWSRTYFGEVSSHFAIITWHAAIFDLSFYQETCVLCRFICSCLKRGSYWYVQKTWIQRLQTSFRVLHRRSWRGCIW